MAGVVKTILCIVALLIGLGCTYQYRPSTSSSTLPERVYVKPQRNEYKEFKVAVFRFTESANAPGVGRKAAEAVYNELLSKDVFAQVINALDVEDVRMDTVISLARIREYDLIITGDVLYYFDGSDFEPSRVHQRFRVVQVSTNETLWYADAFEVASPSLPNDYILLKRSGSPAPPATVLLQKNARKFCGLF